MIKIRLVDWNNLKIGDEMNIDLEHLVMKEIKEHTQQLRHKGIDVKVHVKIKNNEYFYPWLMKKLFPNHEIKDYQRLMQSGVPDFKLINNVTNDEFWVEVKKNSDGLRPTQIDWLLKNIKTETIKLLLIQETNEWLK